MPVRIYRVLTPVEIKQLAKVQTTEEEAEMIEVRNTPMLAALRMAVPMLLKQGQKAKNFKFTGFVGCPHCGNINECGGCAWKRAHPYASRPCSRQTFGGISLEDVAYYSCGVYVNYWSHKEFLRVEDPKLITLQQINKLKRFLVGHIQWARMVRSGKMARIQKSLGIKF